MAYRILPTSSATAQPWHNGGGLTRELLTWSPPGAAAWALRISVATIERDGPFSALPGVRRWFVPLTGAGVRLEWAGRRVELVPGDAPIAFDGDAPPACTLLGGATLDLNLMLRDAHGAMAPVRADTPWLPPRGQGGLYAVQDGILWGGAGERVDLPGHCLAWADQTAGMSPWRFEAAHEARGPTLGYWIAFHA